MNRSLIEANAEVHRRATEMWTGCSVSSETLCSNASAFFLSAENGKTQRRGNPEPRMDANRERRGHAKGAKRASGQ